MCCGQGRAALAAAAAPAAELYVPPSPPPPGASPAPAGEAAPRAATMVRVRYTQQARVRVSGSASGRGYEFSGLTPVQSVDSRDAEGLQYGAIDFGDLGLHVGRITDGHILPAIGDCRAGVTIFQQ